jgi:DNA repair ATPase RecN
MHNWDDDSFGSSLNERQALQTELGEVKILLAQISQQIQTVVSKLQYQETRLSVIEEKLDITPPDRELTPHEQSVLENLEPMDEETDLPPTGLPPTGQTTQDEDISF